jgi:hypothetical protein
MNPFHEVEAGRLEIKVGRSNRPKVLTRSIANKTHRASFCHCYDSKLR